MGSERARTPAVDGWYILAVGVALACGVMLHLRALSTPRYLDDHAQLAMLEHAWPVPRSPLDLFAFARAGERNHLADVGLLPWWTSPRFVLVMGRPLASLLVVLDHALFGRGIVGPHVHSLLWWAATVVAAAVLLRHALPRGTAALAVGLYAVDEAHTLPVSWLANRSVLVATALGLAGTAAHIHWRSRATARGGWTVAVCFTLAALAGEYAAAAVAYVLAWELVLAHGTVGTRMKAVLPAGLPVALTLGAGHLLGSGAAGSGQYLDPLSQPWAYVAALGGRVSTLLADQLVCRTADGPSVVGLLVGGGTAVGVIALGCTAAAMAARTRGQNLAPARHAAWLLLGGLLAMVPVSASIPSSRLLVASGVGFSGVLAILVEGVWATFQRGRSGGLPGLAVWPVCVLAAVLHGGMAPYRTFTESRFVSGFVRGLRNAYVRTAPPRGTHRVVVLAAADPETLHYPPLVWREARLTVPRRWAVLSTAPAPMLLVRTDAFTLEVRSLGAPWLTTAVEDMYRPHDAPLGEGDESDGAGFVATVVASEDGHPRQVRFRFEQDLDAPGTLLVVATPQGLVRVPMPGIHGGMGVPVPGIPGLTPSL